ncbi:hydrophobic surface binding protein A-domain-containing protein [Rhexocercosporidium sp. MPI-PUGE-AT-0058]|nr:hydrophobic surface binding protein A-domain-containing protein [Rhexocercosporidium sp. MPI-PUGE-AT-0058]
MVAIKNVLLFVAAASALTIPLGKRTAATIISDVSTINTNVQALTSAANAYTGGISNALKVQQAEQTLDKSIIQAGKDANATAALSSADSTKISDAIQSLIPNIDASIKAIEAKKAQFATDGLTQVVLDDFKSLQSNTDKLADRLIIIASSDVKTRAQQQKATIDSYFAAGIKFFS